MAAIIHKRRNYSVSTSFIVVGQYSWTMNSEQRTWNFCKFTWLSNTMFPLQQISRANKQIYIKYDGTTIFPFFRQTKDKLCHSYLWALALFHSAGFYQSIFHLYHSRIFTIFLYVSVDISVAFFRFDLGHLETKQKTVRMPFVWYSFSF